MGVIARRRAWGTAKPGPGVRLRAGHPLAKGLVAAWLLGEQGGAIVQNLVGGTPGAVGNTPTWDGRGLRGSSSVYVDTGLKPNLGQQWSAVVRFIRWPGSSSFASLLSNYWPYDSVTPALYCYTDVTGAEAGSTGSIMWRVRTATQTARLDMGGAVLSGDSRECQWAITYRAGAVAAWFNGAVPGTTATVTTEDLDLSLNTQTLYLMASQNGFTGGTPAGPEASLLAVYLYKRALSPSELQWLYAEPYVIAVPPAPRLFTILMPTTVPQLAAPISDISAGSWTPSSGGALYAMVDETVADDSDLITSAANPVADTSEVKLGPLGDPLVSTGHVLRIRIRKKG